MSHASDHGYGDKVPEAPSGPINDRHFDGVKLRFTMVFEHSYATRLHGGPLDELKELADLIQGRQRYGMRVTMRKSAVELADAAGNYPFEKGSKE